MREEKFHTEKEALMTLQVEAQKEYVIRNFYDLIQALREHPDWLEELRRLILTSELLDLPKKLDQLIESFERFKKEEFQPVKEKVERIERDVEILKQDVAVLKEDVAVLKQDVAVLKQDVAGLKKDMNYLKGEFGRFKGKEFERTVRERYPAYLGRLLRKAKLRTFEELLEWVSEAEDKGLLSPEEADEILRLDLVIEGELKHSRKPVFLAVEVSVSLYPEDLDRALRRADLLFRILQKEVIPVVIFAEGKEELEGLAQEKGVLALKVPY